MPTSGATVDKKKGYSSSPSSSTPKSGRWPIISQTVLLGQIFLQLMLMGHFGPNISTINANGPFWPLIAYDYQYQEEKLSVQGWA